MATITLDIDQFRAMFPAFADPVEFPDATIQMWWDVATCYISDEDYGHLSGDCRQYAINYMTAHLLYLSTLTSTTNGTGGGQTMPGYVTSATVDKVTVQKAAPPSTDEWTWWLNQTPYGQAFLALLQARAVGGFVVGGLPETSPYRRVGGYAGPGVAY